MLLMLCCYFNSIKVRLELLIQHTENVKPHFNSIKVRLELSVVLLVLLVLFYFNSIKVRLERSWSRRSIRALYINFNSIKVRLEPGIVSQRDHHLFYFNSIKVRLERIRPTIHQRREGHFNSIKVRLELSSLFAFLLFRLFQFHKGAIRTCSLSIKAIAMYHFNSIKVRLEH